MSNIEHFIEPRRLWVVWQPPVSKQNRRRCIVAEIVSNNETDTPLFRYLVGTEDFDFAVHEGFHGYPAFNPLQHEHKQGVMEAFMRRVPPRKRGDFKEYLNMYRLPENFNGSDIALLAYTGAKLPSDGFEIAPDLTDARPPFEFVLEVAGFRHQQNASVVNLKINDPVRFVFEPENQMDSKAIAIWHNDCRIGYVGRPYRDAFHHWLKHFRVEAKVERINGKQDWPLVYLFITVR